MRGRRRPCGVRRMLSGSGARYGDGPGLCCASGQDCVVGESAESRGRVRGRPVWATSSHEGYSAGGGAGAGRGVAGGSGAALLLLGPLACGWTTWFTKYGGPTAHKWSKWAGGVTTCATPSHHAGRPGGAGRPGVGVAVREIAGRPATALPALPARPARDGPSESIAKAPIEPERRRRNVDIPRFRQRPIPPQGAFTTDSDTTPPRITPEAPHAPPLPVPHATAPTRTPEPRPSMRRTRRVRSHLRSEEGRGPGPRNPTTLAP